MALTTSVVAITDAHRRHEIEAILADLFSSRDADAVGVLLLPAFSGETLLRYEPRAATIAASGYATSLSALLFEVESRPVSTKERLLEKYRGVRLPSPTMAVWSEVGEAATGLADSDALAAAFREAEAAGEMSIGADGITVLGFFIEAGNERRFEDWSPRSGSSSHRFVRLLYQLASQNLRSTEVEQRLEELNGYLAFRLQ